jgi:hypothetical protein
MAANLSGMFAQMNNAIQQAPTGGGLLDIASQNFGGLMADQLGVQDRMKFMNQGAQGMEAQTIASQSMTSNNPGTMRQAAAKLMQAGNDPAANKLLQQADALESKQTASLAAIGEKQKEDAERTKLRGARKITASVARKRGDVDAASAIEAGSLSPEDYMKALMERDSEHARITAEMARDAAKEKNKARYDTDEGLSATMQKRVNLSNDLYDEATAKATEADMLIGELTTTNFTGGAKEKSEEWLETQLGSRGEVNKLKVRLRRLMNEDFSNYLPPGQASDKDVEIARSGFPYEGGADEIREYLEAVSRIEHAKAARELARGNYIQDHGDEAGFPSYYNNYIHREAYLGLPEQARLMWESSSKSAEEAAKFKEAFKMDPYEVK